MQPLGGWSMGRRRMAVLAGSALPVALCMHGLNLLIPLWATRELGYTAAEWGGLRSIRFVGVVAFMLVLGPMSGRLGPRVSIRLTLALLAASLVGMVWGGGKALTLTYAAFGGSLAICMVNLNALAQAVSRRRQGTANGLYRSVTATGSILGPLLATSIAAWSGSYTLVILGGGVLLLAAMGVCIYYPGGEDVAPQAKAEHLGAEMMRMGHNLCLPLRQRGYVVFLLTTLVPIGILQIIGAFLAIRLTADLGVSEPRVGLAFSLGGVLTLGINLMGGWVLERCGPRGVFCMIFAVSGLLLAGIGLTRDAGTAWICLLALVPCLGFVMGPLSLWLSRLRGECSDTLILSSHKLWFGLGAAGLAAGMGGFESRFGLSSLILCSGLALLAFVPAVWMLPSPSSSPATRAHGKV